MHIPDGFLATPVWAALDVTAVAAVAAVARRAKAGTEETRTPLLGVMGAFVFAAQMINFPVGMGTSGHLVGSALLAVTLGPAAASVVMTAILAVQAFVFQDGGILALGANVFNMAIAGVFAAYAPYHWLARSRYRNLGIALGAFLSVAVGASLAIVELLLSGVQMPRGLVWTSAGLFAVAALVEAAITVVVVRALERVRPRSLHAPESARSRGMALLGVTSVLLASAGALLASAAPDGLEALAEAAGIAHRARALLPSPMPDYELAAGGPEWLRKTLAGLAGLLVMLAVSLFLGRLLARKRAAGGGA